MNLYEKQEKNVYIIQSAKRSLLLLPPQSSHLLHCPRCTGSEFCTSLLGYQPILRKKNLNKSTLSMLPSFCSCIHLFIYSSTWLKFLLCTKHCDYWELGQSFCNFLSSQNLQCHSEFFTETLCQKKYLRVPLIK